MKTTLFTSLLCSVTSLITASVSAQRCVPECPPPCVVIIEEPVRIQPIRPIRNRRASVPVGASLVRAPGNLNTLNGILRRIVRANNIPLNVTLHMDWQRSSPVARIRGRGNNAEIFINPEALRSIPANSWAFILAHEISHPLIRKGGTPDSELEADLHGAQYASRAGYEPAAYLAWVFSGPRRCSSTHGCNHDRATAIGNRLRIPPHAVRRYYPLYRRHRRHRR